MDKFNRDELLSQRREIVDLLRSTGREGIEDLIKFLDKSKYFFCWGSFRHHKYVGGLAEHSLEIYKYAIDNNVNCDINSIIIASLLHDVCKVQNIFPDEVKEYFSYGHGSKSVRTIEEFVGFKLTDEERRAIRFHMGSKSRVNTEYEKQEYNTARNEELWELIHTGDCISCGNYPKGLHSIVKGVITSLGL